MAFADCNYLKKIKFSANVDSFKFDNTTPAYAIFANCENLRLLVFLSTSDIHMPTGEFFKNCINLTTAIVTKEVYDKQTPAVIKSILEAAGAKNMANVFYSQGQSVVIPAGTKDIVAYAFSDEKELQNVTIPSSVTTIGMYAFSGCSSLTSIEIPASVTTIENRAFFNSGLKSITFSSTTALPATIENDAFENCAALKSVTLTQALYDYIENNEGDVITALNAKLEVKTITQVFYTKTIAEGVTEIQNSEFSGNTKLKSVTIPSSVTTIGNDAFNGCSELTSIEVPESVETIGTSTFSGCSSLESATIPSSLTSIGDDAFNGCQNLESITFSGASAAPASTFKLRAAPVGLSATIGVRAFNGCSNLNTAIVTKDVYEQSGNVDAIKSTLNDEGASIANVFYIDQGSVVIPDGVIEIPASVNSIKSGVFANHNDLTGIAFLSTTNLPVIGENTFTNCPNLNSITITPEIYNSLGGNDKSVIAALNKKLGINTIKTVKKLGVEGSGSNPGGGNTGGDTPGGGNSGGDTSGGGTSGGDASGGGAPGGDSSGGGTSGGVVIKGDKPKPIEIIYPEEGVADGLNISNYVVSNYTGTATAVDIPDTVISIGSQAFKDCGSLTSIRIPESVTLIEDNAFSNCSNLTTLIFPSSAGLPSVIGENAFSGCSNLKTVIVEKEVHDAAGEIENIKNTLRNKGASNITNVLCNMTVPVFISDICYNANSGYADLASITFLATSVSELPTITSDAFKDSVNLNRVVVTPELYTALGNNDAAVMSAMNEKLGVSSIKTVKKIADISYPYTIVPVGENGTDLLASATWDNRSSWLVLERDANAESPLFALRVDKDANRIGVMETNISLAYDESDLSNVNTNSTTLIKESSTTGYVGRSGGDTGVTMAEINALLKTGKSWRTFADYTNGNKFFNASNENAFSGGNGLDVTDIDITIPYGVNIIGGGAFKNCGNLRSVTMPDSVTKIGNATVTITKFYMGNTEYNRTERSGSSESFAGCSRLERINIPNSVTEIQFGSFKGCSSLESVTIPSSVTSMDTNVFGDCSSLKVVNFPADSKIGSIPAETFWNCSALRSVTIPNSVTSIKDRAFVGCSNLKSITIPASITEIGVAAFSSCANLKTIAFLSNSGLPATIGNGAFNGLNESKIGHVFVNKDLLMSGQIDATKVKNALKVVDKDVNNPVVINVLPIKLSTASDPGVALTYDIANWVNKATIDIMEIPDAVEIIGFNAFQEFSNLIDVTIPPSVRMIDQNAFENCTALTNVTFSSTSGLPATIAGNAFQGCSALKSVTLTQELYTLLGNNDVAVINELKTKLGVSTIDTVNHP